MSDDQTKKPKEQYRVSSEESGWLREIIDSMYDEDGRPRAPKKNTTSSLLKSQGIKMNSQSVLPLLHYIKEGDKHQQHDAAKALGYMSRSGAMTASQKLEARVFLTEILQKPFLTIGVAFAILEALERIDPDAFWTMVMGWYGTIRQQKGE